MDKCPICEYNLNECQCYYDHSNNNSIRAEVCYEHLYLFSKAQVAHIIKLQKFKQISYSDTKRSDALEAVKAFVDQADSKGSKVGIKAKESDIPGTSCLVRIHNPQKFIKIAYRKVNKNYPDSVCITNTEREKFFADAKANNGYVRKGYKYIITETDSTFDKWNDFIDQRYEES